jgi:DNA/RNA endonuclease YhcR with UshA esterase domain
MFPRTALSIVALACFLVLGSTGTRAADDATSKPSTQPSGEVIDVKDFAKLKDMIGTTVTVRGKVKEVFVPQSGSVSIFNFDGINRRDFNVVVPKANLEEVNKAFDGDVAKAVKDQTITVTGAVADYRGNPQIQLTKPDQLKVEKKE